jgi:hypothetical protein
LAFAAAPRTRERFGAALTAEAIDHMLVHDPGAGRVRVPLTGLSAEMRGCLAMLAVELQAEMNSRRGSDNPVVFARSGDGTAP